MCQRRQSANERVCEVMTKGRSWEGKQWQQFHYSKVVMLEDGSFEPAEKIHSMESNITILQIKLNPYVNDCFILN